MVSIVIRGSSLAVLNTLNTAVIMDVGSLKPRICKSLTVNIPSVIG
jgi:hypothetical protein